MTPVLYASARRDRLSAIGAVTLSPRRGRIGVYFRLHDDNIHAVDVVGFLRDLHRQLRRPMIVVLDRFNVHRAAVRQLQEAGADWLQVEWLPAYAPDLNPVEALWSCTKRSELANFAPDNLGDLADTVVDSFCRQRSDQRLKESYFHTARLDL